MLGVALSDEKLPPVSTDKFIEYVFLCIAGKIIRFKLKAFLKGMISVLKIHFCKGFTKHIVFLYSDHLPDSIK
ncbi:hypothetical protein A6A26_12675 [Pantoea sp. OXWO6B1]|nr:hypothetical protein A6A26_12675 [Pantoea sp. OXWO6B1]